MAISKDSNFFEACEDSPGQVQTTIKRAWVQAGGHKDMKIKVRWDGLKKRPRVELTAPDGALLMSVETNPNDTLASVASAVAKFYGLRKG